MNAAAAPVSTAGRGGARNTSARVSGGGYRGRSCKQAEDRAAQLGKGDSRSSETAATAAERAKARPDAPHCGPHGAPGASVNPALILAPSHLLPGRLEPRAGARMRQIPGTSFL